MKPKPECRKCGVPHWRFVPCAEAPVRNELEEKKAARVRVVPQYRTGHERVFVSEFNTFEQGGGTGNVFYRKHDDAA